MPEYTIGKPMDVLIIGAGMIVHDQILPSVYHLKRLGLVNTITVVAKSTRHLRILAEDDILKTAFPGMSFRSYPDISEDPSNEYPRLYLELLEKAEPHNMVIIALPDQMHYRVIKEALEANQHILCVKPLVLKYSEAREIGKIAYDKGLYVGVEYHKRFDRRTLLARKHYRNGDFGEFILGEAKLIEPYYYRNSNFQNWFTPENTDPFVYVGCHYWDMVHFITGLKPVEVSVKGIRRKFPNGNPAFMWAVGRIVYENGAILTVSNGLGYPDDAAGSNQQGIEMFFEGEGKTGYLRHNDQFRGVEYSFLDGIGPGGSYFNYVNPDYFKLVPFEGDGLRPVGYGYDSIEAHVKAVLRVRAAGDGDGNKSREERRAVLREIDRRGILATPESSWINELVTEAARKSILNGGINVKIIYDNSGDHYII